MEALLNAKSLEQALQEAFRTADTLQAPLDAGLKFYLGESRKLLPELEATYDQLDQLAASMRLLGSGPQRPRCCCSSG
jgi:hypothetical protein